MPPQPEAPLGIPPPRAPVGIAPVGLVLFPLAPIPLGSAVGRVPVIVPVGRAVPPKPPPGAPPFPLRAHCVLVLVVPLPLPPLLLDEPEQAASRPRAAVAAIAGAPRRSASFR